MKQFIFLLCLCFSITALSQNKSFKISGQLQDEATKAPLEAATIYLERVKDSSMVTYTISDRFGKFTLEGDTSDKSLNLFISYVGFATHVQNIAIDKAEIDLKSINLKESANTLDEVLIKSKAPVTIKKDTLEFNVKSFKTKANASVEDLLKKLPGVEVDKDGKIKVNGKEVNKILVNGKPFFANDPTIATKNLTKELIEKVQITDTKSKSEAYAGEQGSDENKTINLTIKEENNKGVFGRLSAGGGTDKRYEYAGIANYFNNDQRVSVLAGGNNINSPGFSFGEIQKMFGGGRSVWVNSNGSFGIDGRSFGGGEGIVTSRNVGANFADDIGEAIQVTADYFYAKSSSENENITERENILPDRRYFTDSRSNSSSDNTNQTASVGFEIELDSTFLVTIDPSFNFGKSERAFNRSQNSRDELLAITNQSTSSNVVTTDRREFANDLGFTKRFGDKGSFVRFNMDTQVERSEDDEYFNSLVTLFDTTPSQDLRNQYTNDDNKSYVFGTGLTYRFPIKAKELFLDFSYNYRRSKSGNTRSTFDFNELTQTFDNFNTALSTDFDYIDQRSTPGMRLRLQKKKWSASIGANRVFRTLESKDFLRPKLSLERDFQATELNFNFNYRFSPKARIYLGYSLNNEAPQLSQLQPFVDVSNPLNSIVGNPNLKPSNRHWMYASYNGFDFQKGSGFSAYFNGSVTDDNVVTKSTIDANNIRSTTYENVDGVYRLYGSLRYTKKKKIDSLRTLKYTARVWGNFNQNVNFNNDVKYNSRVFSVTPQLGVEFSWKDIFEIEPNYRVNISQTSYDIDNFEDQDVLQHELSLEFATFVPKQLEWRNDIGYTYNPNVAEGFDKSAIFWNSSLTYSFMKDKASLRLKVYDLLNQNINTRRIATANYIQDSQSTVLRRYAMLTFSWKFNSLGKKGEVGKDQFMFF